MEFRSIGLEGLLLPLNEYPYTFGDERELKSGTEQVRYYVTGRNDSHRFVLFVDGIPVSGIQIMKLPGEQLCAANVYTDEKFRNKGYAKFLFIAAKKKLKGSIVPSKNLSPLGKIHAEKVVMKFG